MGYRDFIESEAIRIAQSTPGDAFPNVDFDIPAEYHDEVKSLLINASTRDTNAQAGEKWHRAANIVQGELRNDGVPHLSTWSHRALMRIAATIEG